MNWILISAMLYSVQPVYQDEKTCTIAMERLNAAYPLEGAMCIPMPAYTETSQDRVFTNFFELIEKIVELENKNKTVVDKQ